MVSYIVTSRSYATKFHEMMVNAKLRYPWQKIYDLDEFIVGLLGYQEDQDNCYLNKKLAIFISGDIVNIQQIRMLLLVHDARAYDCSIAELMYLVFYYLSDVGFTLLEGRFSVICYCEGRLKIFNDIFGQMPCYYICTPNQFWITTELKNFISNVEIDLSIIPYQEYIKRAETDSLTSVFQSISRVVPNNLLLCIPQRNYVKVRTYQLHEFKYKPTNKISFEAHLGLIHKLFSESIENHLANSMRPVGVTLSGGIDCPVIAYALRQCLPNEIIYSYTLGSEERNEFDRARIVANFVGSHHQEILISKEEILANFIEVMYNTETYTALGIELMVQLDKIYQCASTQVTQLFVGYGPDNVYGGYFSPDRDVSEVNYRTYLWTSRLRVSTAFAAFSPARYGIQVEAPMCNNKLFQLGLSMDPSYKLNGEHAKYIWRKYADVNTELPKDIVWGKKVDIQEGSAVNNIFSDLLGTARSSEYSNYQYKNPYVYAFFCELFENRVSVLDVDIDKVITSVTQESNNA